MYIVLCPSIDFMFSIFIYEKGKRKVSVDESKQKYRGYKKITCENLDENFDDLDGRITNLEDLFKWVIKERAGNKGKKYSSSYDLNTVFCVCITLCITVWLLNNLCIYQIQGKECCCHHYFR